MLNLSIFAFNFSKRLVAATALIAILFSAAVVVTMWKVEAIDTRTNRIKVLRAPTAAASASLTSNIFASLAALRGWMLTGNASFKTERAAVWMDIANTRAAMDDLSKNWTSPRNVEIWSEFKTVLDEFAAAQKRVEAIANSADERPATKILIDEAAPRATVMVEKITEMINLELANPSVLKSAGNGTHLLGIMADVRGTLGLGLANIRAYLLTGDKKFIERFEKLWAKNDRRFLELEKASLKLSAAQKEAFVTFAENRAEFVELPTKMFTIRDSKQWNIANYKLVTEAMPRAAKLLTILVGTKQEDGSRAGGMKDNQISLLNKDAEKLVEEVTQLFSILLVLLTIGITACGATAYFTKAQQVVKRHKEDLTQILNNVPRAIITSDTSGIIKTFNPEAEQTFGYTAAEAIGHNVSLLMPEQDKKHHDDYIRSYMKTGVGNIIESGPRRLVGRRKDGTEFPLELALAIAGQGKKRSFISIAQDITEELNSETRLVEHRNLLQQEVDLATEELKAQAVELQEALAREQKLNKLQRQFVSMASHEFRTPLAIIDATAQRMKRRADKNRLTPEDAVQRVEKIRYAVQRMTRLIESTLDTARMEEGKIKIKIKACDCGKIVREVCEHQQELSKAHVISWDLTDLPVIIQADPCSLEQVLTNLLSNAVKYAPDAPDIEVIAHAEGDHVVIQVRDQGVGIDEDELDRVGERFFRARTSTGTAGTGIGLNLVKMLVEMHGGSVNVESQKGEGSTFTIRLPIAGPDHSEQVEPKVA